MPRGRTEQKIKSKILVNSRQLQASDKIPQNWEGGMECIWQSDSIYLKTDFSFSEFQI